MADDTLSVGGRSIPMTEAERKVAEYLSAAPAQVWGYPHYDHFDTGSGPDRLSDGDLLAANLLNARVTLAGYAALQPHRRNIEVALAAVPQGVSLLDATDTQIATLGPLFDLIQDKAIAHVGATTFAKIVHRKRPALIPLWDSHIKAVYQDHRHAPLTPGDWELPWRSYIIEVARAMRSDLAADPVAWRRLSQGKVTLLRALDIVAWSFAGANDVEAH